MENSRLFNYHSKVATYISFHFITSECGVGAYLLKGFGLRDSVYIYSKVLYQS